MARRLLFAFLLLTAAAARAARYPDAKSARERLENIDKGLATLDQNIANLKKTEASLASSGVNDGGSVAAMIRTAQKAREALERERPLVKAQIARFERPRNGDVTPLPEEDRPDRSVPAAKSAGAGTTPPAGAPQETPDIPAAPLPGEPGGGVGPNGDAPEAADPAAEAAMAKAGAGAEGRAAAASARAQKLGATLGEDNRSPEDIPGGGSKAKESAGRAGGSGGSGGSSAPPPPPGAAGPGASVPPAAASGGELGGAMSALGLKAGRDAAGRPAVVRADGSPATNRELELIRADAGGILPYAAHRDLLAAHAARADLRETDFKHVDVPPSEKDFRWSKSCDKVSGECNKHARKGSYKRGEHVAPDDLADIWKAVKSAAGFGAPRGGDDGSSHFARMRAMLAGGGAGAEGSEATGGVYAGGGGARTDGAAPPAPGAPVRGSDGTLRAEAAERGASAPVPAPRGRPLWPAWLIAAVVGGGALWALRRRS